MINCKGSHVQSTRMSGENNSSYYARINPGFKSWLRYDTIFPVMLVVHVSAYLKINATFAFLRFLTFAFRLIINTVARTGFILIYKYNNIYIICIFFLLLLWKKNTGDFCNTLFIFFEFLKNSKYQDFFKNNHCNLSCLWFISKNYIDFIFVKYKKSLWMYWMVKKISRYLF